MQIVETKKTDYLSLTGKKYTGDPEILQLKKEAIYPLEAYQSYTAHETNTIQDNSYYQNRSLRTISARQITTHFFEAQANTPF